MQAEVRDHLAKLPQIEVLLRHPDATAPVEIYGRRSVTEALRAEVAAARASIRQGAPAPAAEHLIAAATARLAGRRSGGLARVINATGVVLHTNLGRAPLSDDARGAVLEAMGYTSLEYDLGMGGRGSRTAHLGELAAELCGTEAATVVNNGAAALTLVLAALASAREVPVSRGELIEIGGSYRLPEMMVAAGCDLVEVGTTNRTRLADYRAVINERTALLLKVHRSNFEIRGFTQEAAVQELAELAGEHGLPFVHDLGSGLMHEVTDGPLAGEPAVESSVRAGSDLVIFSGDKLLGGPQAGVIAGSRALVRRCTRHPLARAMRVDKLQRAALEATLEAHLRSNQPVEVPTVRMLTTDPERLRQRAERLAGQLGEGVAVLPVDSVIGGGSLPGVTLPSWAVALIGADASGLAASLRAGDPPVIARIEDERVVLDLRTVAPSEDPELHDLIARACGRSDTSMERP